MSAETLTPQRLCALLDDEAAPAAKRDMERMLATDPDATRQLAVWRRNDDALRTAFGLRRADARDESRPSALSPIGPLRARDMQRGRTLVMLAVGAAFVAGALCAAAMLLLLHMVRTP